MNNSAYLCVKGLLLCPSRRADATCVQALAGDERVADTTVHSLHPYPDGVAEKWIRDGQAAWRSGARFSFAVTLADTAKTGGRHLVDGYC